MLRLSKLTDYAIAVLAFMPGPEAPTRTAADLARRSGLAEPTVAKVLKPLVPAGIVLSVRGATGGYRLARPPERITVLEVIVAIDGPIALTACVDGSAETCQVQHACAMRGNWTRVNDAVRGALSAVTLAEMLVPPFDFAPVPARRPDADAGLPADI